MSPRAVITLSLDCTNACVFCAQAGAPPGVEASSAEVRAELRRLRTTHDGVTFAGGEPGLVATLEVHVAAAREEGFARVGVQTNGSGLENAARLRLLAMSGLTDLHLTLLGAEPAVHDYHTGRAQSFERALQCLAGARSVGLEVAISTVLSRSNFRTLDALANLIVAHGASGWCISVPVVAGRAQVDFDRVVPRLGLALPFALRALTIARASGVGAFIAGAPLCLLGPHGALAIEADVVAGPRRSHSVVCETCPVYAECPGVDAAYLARFDGDELAHRTTTVAPAVSPRLAELFVGPGLRVAVRPFEAATSPSKARRGLPMLGRGQPAIAEASRGEKRSGEALRALFPGLFDERSPKPDGDGGADS